MSLQFLLDESRSYNPSGVDFDDAEFGFKEEDKDPQKVGPLIK